MRDITEIKNNDIQLFDTQVPKAANILSVQLGSLEYAPDLGIDLVYFLSEDFKVENASFKAYLVEVLARRGINVAVLTDLVQDLSHKYTIELTPEENTTGLIAR